MDMLWQAIANMFSTKGDANIQAEWIAFRVLQFRCYSVQYRDDVIKWKHFLRYWPFVRGFHQSLVNFPHKGQWRAALMFSMICVRINGWVNNRMADDLRRYCVHYDVIVIITRNLKNRVHIWTTMHKWVMNIQYQTWIAQGRFINMIRTPSKQWGVCDKSNNVTLHTSLWRVIMYSGHDVIDIKTTKE